MAPAAVAVGWATVGAEVAMVVGVRAMAEGVRAMAEAVRAVKAKEAAEKATAAVARPKQGEKAAQSAPNFADIASVTSGSTVDVTDTMASFIPPPPPRVPPGRDMVYSLPAETDQKMM